MSRAVDVPTGAEMIVAVVAASAGVRASKLTGPRRYASLVRLRTVAARRCRDAGYSLPEIGAALHRDHTTVLSMLRGGKHKSAA